MNVSENKEGNLIEVVDPSNIQLFYYRADTENEDQEKPLYNVLVLITDVHFKNCNLYIRDKDNYKKYFNNKIYSNTILFEKEIDVRTVYVISNCIFEDSYFENDSILYPYINGISDFTKIKSLLERFKLPIDILVNVYTKCIIEGSIFYGFDNLNNISMNGGIINKKYTGKYGYKLVLARSDTESEKIYLPVIIKLRILEDAITITPAIQSNKRHKIRTNKAIVDAVYIVHPFKSDVYAKNYSFKIYRIKKNDIVRIVSDKTNIYVHSNLLSPFYNTQNRPEITKNMEYSIGNIVYEPEFSNSPIQCDKGIHFFKTMGDALNIYIRYINIHWINRTELEIIKIGDGNITKNNITSYIIKK